MKSKGGEQVVYWAGQDISVSIGYSVTREQSARTEFAPSSWSAESIPLLLNLLVKRNLLEKRIRQI
jgi:hypothetical protein